MAAKKIITMKPVETPPGRDGGAHRDSNASLRAWRKAQPPDGAATAPEGQADTQAQFKAFEQGTRLFRAGKFSEARELFQKAGSGPSRQISHHAQSHALMCARRLEKGPVELQTPDDHYNYAVALINARNLAGACEHLENALKQDPRADHVYYALALCRGLGGDVEGACENLKRAIELQPRNRVAARQDTDFAAIASHPLLHQILYPERM